MTNPQYILARFWYHDMVTYHVDPDGINQPTFLNDTVNVKQKKNRGPWHFAQLGIISYQSECMGSSPSCSSLCICVLDFKYYISATSFWKNISEVYCISMQQLVVMQIKYSRLAIMWLKNRRRAVWPMAATRLAYMLLVFSISNCHLVINIAREID